MFKRCLSAARPDREVSRRAGLPNTFLSEDYIDNQTTQLNYPNTIQLGDVTKIKAKYLTIIKCL
jgi:hypothetical protein